MNREGAKHAKQNQKLRVLGVFAVQIYGSPAFGGKIVIPNEVRNLGVAFFTSTNVEIPPHFVRRNDIFSFYPGEPNLLERDVFARRRFVHAWASVATRSR